MSSRQVLVTGTSSPIGREVVAHLSAAGEHTHGVDGTPGIDARQLSWSRHHRHEVPPVGSPSRVPALLRLARAHGIELIVPTLGEELLELATASPLFAEHGIRLVVSDPLGLSRVGDGLYASRALTASGIPVVWSRVPSDLGPTTNSLLPESDLVLMVPRTPWTAAQAVSIFDPTDFHFPTIGDSHLVCAVDTPLWRVSLSAGDAGLDATVTCQRDRTPIATDPARAAIELAERTVAALSLTGPVEVGVAGGLHGRPRVLDVTAGIGSVLTSQPDHLVQALLGDESPRPLPVLTAAGRGAAPAGPVHD